MHKAPRGRPAKLNREKIVAAALDFDLETLSIEGLARQLKVTGPALYRHVGSREALIDACLDHVCQRIEVPPDSLDWRPYLHALGHAFRNIMLLHPGVCHYAAQVGPTTSAGYALIDNAMRVLKRAGFEPENAWRGYSLVVDHAFVFGQKEHRYARLTAQGSDYGVMQEMQALSERYPDLGRALKALQPGDFDTAYEAELSVLLSGIAHELAAHEHNSQPMSG